MTGNPADFSDEQLLTALQEGREWRVKLEAEIEARFEERTSGTINSPRIIAKRRNDTTRYQFSEAELLLLAAASSDETEWQRLKDAGRQISRPFVSLSVKEENHDTD